MGIDRWSYLGPYAELTLPLVSKKVDTCRQANCPNAQSGTFCPTCGMELKRRFHEYLHTEPPFDMVMVDHLKEALHRADGMSGPQMLTTSTVVYRVVPNQTRRDQPREFHVDTDSDLWVDISGFDVEGEIEWFKKAFAPEWNELLQFYGKFAFKWGYLQWFN